MKARWIALGLSLLLTILSATACNQTGDAGSSSDDPGEASILEEADGVSTASPLIEVAKASENAEAAASGIYTRTTARAFSDTPVTEEQTDALIKAAFASPTGGNQRSWEFVIVTNREVMTSMKAGNPYSQALDTAPLVIVVAVDEETALYPELLGLDAGIATQSILVQAGELGLSTVAMSIAPQAERIQGVSTALFLPGHVVPQIMVAVGYPATDAAASASVSFYSESKVHYNQYS